MSSDMNETLRVYEGAVETLQDIGDEDVKVFPRYTARGRRHSVPAIEGDVAPTMIGWAIARAYLANGFENEEFISYQEMLDALDEALEHIPTCSDAMGTGVIVHN